MRGALVLLATVVLLTVGSAAQTFTVGTGGVVSIAGPPGTITRGNNFKVTISGESLTGYYLWVSGSSSLSGAPGDQPPLLPGGQVGVSRDPPGGPYTIGSHRVAGGGTIREDVPVAPSGGTGYYALVTTDEEGTRTVEWATSQETALRTFTIHVERGTGTEVVSDDAGVTVVQGALTIMVNGQMISAYLGEEVDLTGVNTGTNTTYLSITGPNLPSSGGRLDSPRTPVVDGDPSTFTRVDVNTDGTWRYRWQTRGLGLDAGVYTVFAVSTPSSSTGLGDTAYGTTSVNLATSPVSGPETTPVVAQGDPFSISGIAAGAQRVAIWIFGTNRLIYGTDSPNSDGSFSYELSGGVTSSLSPGQYVAVVQHPGPLGVFDVTPSADGTSILLSVPSPGSSVNIAGLGASQGAYALISALNSPYIDDTYTSLTFLVNNPMVSIDTIGQVAAGRPVVVTGTTNLAPGDQLIVSVYSAAFTPTSKTQSGEFFGTSGSVTVQPGAGGLNRWTFPVDTRTFAPGMYLVLVSGAGVPAGDSTSFTLLPATPATTTVPPTTITTPVPVPAPLPATTEPATPAATPVPGFGIIQALAGSAGVAISLERKRRS